MTKYELSSLAVQCVIALGSLVVAGLAVYGDAIRRWLFKPYLEMKIGIQPPFTELLHIDEEFGDSRTAHEIRIQVLNSGKSIARNCKAVIDSIYEQRAGSGDMYLSKEFIPRACLWDGEQKAQDLLPKIPTYVFVARIEEKGEMATENSGSQNTPACSLFIMIEERKGVFLEVGHGKHIMPIVIYADNISKPVKKYLEIFWNGRSAKETDKAHFNIQLHTETQFKKLIGGAS